MKNAQEIEADLRARQLSELNDMCSLTGLSRSGLAKRANVDPSAVTKFYGGDSRVLSARTMASLEAVVDSIEGTDWRQPVVDVEALTEILEIIFDTAKALCHHLLQESNLCSFNVFQKRNNSHLQ